jgi:DNA-directed RNA polymerase specialized sigma24 family protein
MVDQYGTLIQMSLEGKAPEEIAKMTGWPADAVQTMIEELVIANEQEQEQ